MSFLSLTGFGNICRDPEIRTLPSGMSCCQFSIAVNRKVKGEDKATFLDCKAFDKTADNIAKFFKKGSRIIVVGELEQERWKDKTTGEDRQRLSLLVNRFDFPESNKSDDSASDDAPAPRRQAAPASRREAPPAAGGDDVEIPF